MRRATPLLLALLLLGCKGSREKDLVGSWTGTNTSATLTEDKKFTGTVGPMALAGTWTMEGEDVTLTPVTLAGKPLAEVKAMAQKSMSSMPPAQRSQLEGFVKDMDKPNVLTLSADGKTLTTNKTKDTNAGPGMTLTKY